MEPGRHRSDERPSTAPKSNMLKKLDPDAPADQYRACRKQPSHLLAPRRRRQPLPPSRSARTPRPWPQSSRPAQREMPTGRHRRNRRHALTDTREISRRAASEEKRDSEFPTIPSRQEEISKPQRESSTAVRSPKASQPTKAVTAEELEDFKEDVRDGGVVSERTHDEPVHPVKRARPRLSRRLHEGSGSCRSTMRRWRGPFQIPTPDDEDAGESSTTLVEVVEDEPRTRRRGRRIRRSRPARARDRGSDVRGRRVRFV